MTKYVSPVAISEEDPLGWWPRVFPWRVLRAASDEWGERWWTLRLRRRYMREATKADCPVPHPHKVDEYGDPVDDNCECWMADEGWHQECAADHPDAFPVWRVEPGSQPIRRRLRLASRRFLYPSDRPVLWGGRIARRAHWFDRWVSFGGIYSRVEGDYWLKPRETELAWCGSCRALTPHATGRHGYCLANEHGTSRRAPLASDMRTNW